jgi:glycosyltransferase involved in cell wall biosynthesis
MLQSRLGVVPSVRADLADPARQAVTLYQETPEKIMAPPSLRVSYVTMIFPASSETFACGDVQALTAAGVGVVVYAMRRPRPWPRGASSDPLRRRSRKLAAAEVLAERGLADLSVSHGSLAAIARGVWTASRRPSVMLDLISWVVRCNWRAPVHLVKSLALVPRSLDIFASIQTHRPDVVHLFWGHYPAMVGYLVRRHLQEITVSVFLGAYDLERHYPGTAPVARAADVVWTHAHANVGAIACLGVHASRVRVVHRGVDVATSSVDGGKKVTGRVLTAGRLIKEKHTDDVLAVFAKILAREPHASLVVLGDGPERPRLLAMAASLGIAGAVNFLGHVSQHEVRREMAAAEVFVFMSRSEAERLPNVVKEAMASRCVCVVTETPGIRELVTDGKDGFVVAQGDVEGAARRIHDLLQHREHAGAIATAAHEQIIARFDVRHSMSLYEEWWRLLVCRRRGSGAPIPAVPVASD